MVKIYLKIKEDVKRLSFRFLGDAIGEEVFIILQQSRNVLFLDKKKVCTLLLFEDERIFLARFLATDVSFINLNNTRQLITSRPNN